ncbi:MAG: nicotinate phosphoribosyltransferase [bacterium]
MRASRRAEAEGPLFTDLYQLTMAQVYFRAGIHEQGAQFDHFFRSYPDYGEHMAGYCINAGLTWLLEWMEEARFGQEEIAYLRGQTGQSGDRLFGDDFLDWLKGVRIGENLDVQAIPEGRVVHPNVPITVVQGPLAEAQILESPLLNHLNYQTLIATKAARIHQAGDRKLLLEFGMRRAHDRGAAAGARAALIGGADFTSNVGASRVLGLPPKGTHAHSMVQAFMALEGSELDAFRRYAGAYPDDCLLLVDTVDTLESGVPNAITVFEELREAGHEPVGIRLDSGDLAYLAIRSARMLGEAGFEGVSIVLSNQLDEVVLTQILQQIREEAPRYGVDAEDLIDRLVYGVGTRLITSAGDAALDGVYKLVAMREEGSWMPAIKLSETPAKVPNPGHKAVWRIYDERGKAGADLITLAEQDPTGWESVRLRHPTETDTHRTLSAAEISGIEPLLVEVLESGRPVYDPPGLETIREVREEDLGRLDPGVRRIINPHLYHVSLSDELYEMKRELVESMDVEQ